MSYTQYNQNGQNPYHGGPGADTGEYGTPYEQNSTLQQPPMVHQTSNYSGTSAYSNNAPPAIVPPTSSVLTQADFLSRVDFCKKEIGTLTSNIQSIATLHQRALSSPDSNSSQELESLVASTQLKNTQIRDQIKYLELDAAKTNEASRGVKARQAKQLKDTFENELKSYQQEEMQYRKRYQDSIARQYRIVNPEATEEEVNEASQMDWGSEGVFQTALKTNRSGQASSVLGAVRARHNELQRIEQTLTDLAAMFADMAQIVAVQEDDVVRTEINADKTVQDVERGNVEIEKANEHARRRNRLKWWCLLVVVLIILAIALGVGLGVGLAAKSSK